jgi:hypothetical protein
MALNTVGISLLKGNKEIWERVRKVLRVSRNTMYRRVAANDPSLTQAAVLTVFREETGLTDQEILEAARAIEEPQS